MGDNAKEMYEKLYGDVVGKNFINILSTSPDEIAVISRFIAFMMEQKKGEKLHGYSDDSKRNWVI